MLTIIHTQLVFVGSVEASEPLAVKQSSVVTTEAPSGKQKIADLDRTILTEYIRLARFNTKYHITANRHQWWRMYTYPLAREAGGAATFANTLTDLSQQARGLNDPSKISTPSLRNGLCSAISGSAVSGTSSALELCQNTWIMLKAKRLGYGPDASVSFVREWMKTTAALLITRQNVVATEIPPENRKVRDLEGLLMQQMRSQLLFEFRKWNIRSREIAWRENTFYAIDAMQNFTTCAASIASLPAFRYPQIKGNIAITAIVANSAATLNPMLSNLSGVFIRGYQRKKLAEYFPGARPIMAPELSQEMADLEKDGTPDPIAQRSLREAVFLNSKSSNMDQALARETDKIDKLRRIAQQQTYSGTLIGLTGLSRSIISLKAFHTDNIVNRTRLSFSGRISQASGQASSLVDTPATLVKSIINQHRLAAQGKLPSQIFAKRLADLDVLEKQIQSEHPFRLTP